MNNSRQTGKSTSTAALAINKAILKPPALILILSPTLRQSIELFRKVKDFYQALRNPVGGTKRQFKPKHVVRNPFYPGSPYGDYDSVIGPSEELEKETVLTMEFCNGSRIIALPGKEANIRGFSKPAMVIIDEASRVPDSLYRTGVRPMLAASQDGELVIMSTPCGKRGFFYEEWEGVTLEGRELPRVWQQIKVTADQCPRIPSAFLEEERAALGERWFNQEYMASFEDTIDAVFSSEDIKAAINDNLKPIIAA